MFKWILKLGVIPCCLSLFACHYAEEPADLKTYFMQHPLQLRDEIAQCEKPQANAKRCESVATAAAEFNVLVEAQQRDPQGFGKRILRAEIQYANTGKGEDEIKILLAVVSLTGPE